MIPDERHGPIETLRRFATDRVTLTLLLALLAAVAMGHWWPRVVEMTGRNVAQRKLAWERCADTVLAGDSRVATGISPHHLRKTLGPERIKNFAFSAVSYSEEYLDAVDRVLDPSSAGPRVVLGITPFSLTQHPRGRFGALERRAEMPAETRHVGSPLQMFRPLAKRIIIRNWLRPEQATWIRMHFSEDGWESLERHPPQPDGSVEHFRGVYARTRVDPAIVDVIVQAVERWGRRGVRVHALRPPTTRMMVEMENQASGFDEAAFAARIDSAGGTWLEFDASQWTAVDGSHLDADDAKRFSEELGRWILAAEQARAESGGRPDQPEYQEYSVPSAIRNVMDSKPLLPD